MEFLLSWYEANRRDLPWRRTRDPYAIWVSEIMLQQTQVATVIPYWHRWMGRFPTAVSLAESNESEVLELWQGLGYYRRARMLLEGVRWVKVHGMPVTAKKWLQVPGVGPYTAGAIASIAFNDPSPLVDGNVERVYARLAGDRSSGSELNRAAWKWAESVLLRQRPGDWNQALMELGATVCRPVEPDCLQCPLSSRCLANLTSQTRTLPTAKPKRTTVNLTQEVWIPQYRGAYGVRQIATGQWWAGMWEFPRMSRNDAEETVELRRLVGEGWVQDVGRFKHSVTHHRIELIVSYIQVDKPSSELVWVDRENLASLAMPSPQRKAFRLFETKLSGAVPPP